MASIKVSHPLPTPLEDCKKLEEAFQGQGSKEKAIISILAHRNADQLKLISQKYEELYNKKLLQRLQEISGGIWIRGIWGDFWKAVTLWTMDPPQRDANLCNKALRNRTVTKKEVEIIVEIACASSPDHLVEVRRAYCALYRHSLEENIGIRIKDRRLRKLLVYLVSSFRYDGEEVDENLARSEAVSLHNAIVNNNYSTTVEDEAIRILSSRSKTQLKATFHHYNQAYEESIYKDLGSSNKSVFAPVLRTAIYCISSPETHFVQVLGTSIKGMGTDEDALTRAIVTRAEIDMERIKEEYQRLYKTKLEKDVGGDTFGVYKNFLMTLLGCEN